MVVGHCVQVLLSGHTITTPSAGAYRKSPKIIAEMLKALKRRGVVKDLRAIRVLGVCNLFHVQMESGLILLARNFAC
jgi:hypothetical protein